MSRSWTVDVPLEKNARRDVLLGDHRIENVMAGPQDFPRVLHVTWEGEQVSLDFEYSMGMDEPRVAIKAANGASLWVGKHTRRIFGAQIPAPKEVASATLKMELRSVDRQIGELEAWARSHPARVPAREIAHYQLVRSLMPYISEQVELKTGA